jgi:hypothetical protein
MWWVGEKEYLAVMMIMMMLKEKTLIRVSLVFSLHLMTKHSTPAPRDLCFLIKTNSLSHVI